MGYFKDTIRGISWMGGLRVSTRVIAFAKIAILARLLTPSEFGIFGIASLVLILLETITETGINIFLIQEKADLDDYVDTSWIVSIARGIFISLFLFLVTPLIAIFFKSPESRNILYLICLVPLVRGFINPAIVRFQKDLHFGKEFVSQFSIFTFDTLVAVWFAFVTRSAISLVFGLLAGAALELFISFVFISPKPKIRFEPAKVKKVVGRGKWLTLSGIFNYLFENVDDAAVGRLLNTSSLGLYQVAYKVSTLPITEIANVVIKVTLPIYVRISGDLDRLKRAFLKTLVVVTLITLPIGAILLIFTEPMVLLAFGEKWVGIIPIIKVLSFFGVVRAISATSYPLFLALKKQEYITVITLIGILGLVIPLIPLINALGTLGGAISALIGAIVMIPAVSWYTFKVLKNNVKE